MESFSETFDLCAGIRGILDGYPASNAILRELIQNSDDAGSRRQIFILDERQHPTRTLLVPGLACCQGPALLAVNDSIFRPQDWQAIKTIHHSSKADDNTQIGKYGLGFRSSYHVTDFPQILSSRTLVVFDPHMTVLNDGGRKHSTFLPADSTHEDQLAAFSSAVPADCQDYNGTVIRLPLRTSASAKKISSFIPSIDWVKTLFSDFASKECAIEMLFLKSLESIELVHIDTRGNRKELAMSRIVDADGALRAKRKWTVRAGPAMDHYPLTIQTRGRGSSLQSTSWRILHWFAQDAVVLETLRDELGSARRDLKDDLKKDKLFAHAACAFPTDRAVADAGGLSGGHLFTLLPLPILTGFPVHVHGIFALTPTRQALKNAQETGLAGRDAMLVAWNKMMFKTVVPAAWAQLLDVLAREKIVADTYALWPDAGASRDAYWEDIAASVVKVVVKSELCVWPVCAVDKPVFVALSSALVAPPDTEPELLRIIKRLDIVVVAPPAGLYAILSSENLKFEPLSAETIYKRLKKAPHVLNRLDAEERRIIAEYLVAPPADVSCIIGLYLIPLSDGTFSALLQGSCSDANIVVLCDSAAASLFGGCGRMLAAVGQTGPRFRQVLEQLALRQRGAYNLTALTPAIVRSFLLALTSHIPPDADESACMPERVPWALEFWAWVSQWSGSPQLFPLIRDFHLLPTRKEKYRKLSSGILACEAKFPDTLAGKVLHNIGVPFLHDGAAGYVSALQQAGCARNPRDLRFILDTVDVSKCADLSKQHADALKRHLVTIITASYTVSLDAALRSKLAALPIFSIVSTRLTRSGGERVTRFGPAVGKVSFVGQDVTAVPVLPQETFLDSPDSVFRAALQAGACLDEKSLLERVAPHLDAQPHVLLDYLLYRILCRWTDLSTVARNDIQRRKALPVTADGTKRLPLCEAIDPAAAIARLFGMEENVFPAGKFNPKGPWSSLLTGAGVLQSDLTEAIVQERIRYFRARMPDERPVALELLALADAYYCQYPATRWSFPLDVEFLPHPRDKRPLLSLRGCRDGKDGHLFDLVLPVIALKQPIASNALRNALGWTSNVPFDIILRQLACIVNCDAGVRAKHSERLIKIIQSLAPRLQSMPAATLAAFRDVIGEAEWIPVSRTNLRRTSHVTHDVELGPFKRLPTTLLEPQKFAFLEAMGCTRRPTLRALTTELRLVGPQAQDVDLSLDFLKEIAMYHDLDVAARAELLVPDVSGRMHAPDDICFNNVPGTSVEVAGQVALCHPGLSSDIAERLDLRRLSDIFANRAEDEEDEEDEEDFGEDLYDRIRGVLRDYSPNFALNEFIANANDAKATTFSAILDETEQIFTAALSPELAECQAPPALLLYNDGVFTEGDFHRIRRFGRTKETLEEHAVGQFGLGALNFYHFSDVVMVISGAFVLFIDPSKSYIPQKHRSSKRATLKYKLSVLNKTSPQHLARVDGLFGFNQTSESFAGTIIVLPLRSPARAGTSLLSNAPLGVVEMHNLLLGQYLDFARDSLFCTTLRDISCRRRQAGGAISDLWKVAADRDRPDSRRGFVQRVSLQVHVGSRLSRETWFVARTTIAREGVPATIQDSVRKDHFDVTLIATSARPPERSRILSTVPMPVQTALPIHVSAPFIMASDRRTIRLEPPDAAGRRTAGSEFNSWLLENIVPPAYLTLLDMMGHSFSPERPSLALWDWFPASTHDVISQIVTTAFYKALPNSQHEVIHTASKRLISPRTSVLCRNAYESRSYSSLLFRLRPDDLFCPSAELLRFPLAFKGVTTVSAEYARRVLLAKQLSLQRVLESEADRARTDVLRPEAGVYNGVAILLAAIESTLCYLLDSEVPLDGLKILPLANGQLGTLGAQSVVYTYSSSISPPVSFSRSRFIDPQLTLQTRERLVLAISNVHTVNSAQSARDLLAAEVNLRPLDDATMTNAIHECITAFWSDIEYGRIRDVSADMLADMPLLRTDADRRYVSLNFCRQGRAIFPPNASYLGDVIQELKRSGMLFCHESVRRVLPSAEHAALEFTLTNVLRGLSHLGGVAEIFGTMQRPERFASWVRSNLSTGGQRLQDVHRLPIWVAYGAGGQQSLMPADSLCMLPQLWSSREALAVLPQFIPPSASFVAWDWTLDQLLQKFQKLDTQQAFGRLTFPVRCSEAQLADFHALLELLRSTNFTNTSNKAVIPDGSLSVRPPQTLYDHRIPLFASAFQTTSDTAFVHEALHGLIDFLVTLGVRRVVNLDTFLAATRAIHDDSGSQSPEFITRADVVVEAFMNDVPQTMRRFDSQRWYEIQPLCFVPTTTGTVQGLTFNSSGYLPNTDAVVSPAEIVRPEFETIAWTQCARLPGRLTPPPGFLSAFPEFGKPSVATVVGHLKTLATVVAMGHSGNQSLFTCLRDTYQWLNTCADQAKAYLLPIRHLPLFLNIDSSNDVWTFKPASQLAVGLLYDADNLFRVRDWLHPFNDLLLAAGALTIVQAEFQRPAPPEGSAEARLAVLDTMRRSKVLTDCEFVSHTGRSHAAHKVVLASGSAHLRESFSGEWSDSSTRQLDETDFCIESALSFLYVGRVERPVLQTNEEAGEMLGELLELLRLADMWNLPGLKDEVTTIIAGDLKLVGPTTVHEIARQAARWHADTLKRYCDEFIRKNRSTLDKLDI